MSVLNTAYLGSDPTCNVIGPQIGPLFSDSGVAITLGLPHRTDIEEISCRLYDETRQIVSVKTCHPAHPKYRNYRFDFPNLNAGFRYFYEFYSRDQLIELEAGL